VTDTLQLEDPIQLRDPHDAPKLLVEWSPRWQEFVTSIRPAFARSGARLAGEAPHGIFPYPGMLACWILQAFLLFVIIVIPREIARLRPYAAPKVRPYEVIYYSGDELPRTEDLGGAQSGATGRAGGHEVHHRTQTIHVARGGSLSPKVVDAPDVKLPSTADAVANLLAFKSKTAPASPGPPPSEGLHSTLVAPRLPASVIAPPSSLARDQSRAARTLDSVVPPAPNISSDRSRSAPALNAAVVPPAPSIHSEHTLFAPALDPSIVAPAPSVSRERTRAAPPLNTSVIAPASTRVSSDQERSTPVLNASVIPPSPAALSREVSPSRVEMNNVAIVPPPVSAPERETSRNAKLSLPAPSVVAPPPSADSDHDLRRLESGSTDPSKAVVPPPPTRTSNGSFVSTVIGKLFGTQDVVPPPPIVAPTGASGTARNGGPGGSLANNVVPPPPGIPRTPAGRGPVNGCWARHSLDGVLLAGQGLQRECGSAPRTEIATQRTLCPGSSSFLSWPGIDFPGLCASFAHVGLFCRRLCSADAGCAASHSCRRDGASPGFWSRIRGLQPDHKAADSWRLLSALALAVRSPSGSGRLVNRESGETLACGCLDKARPYTVKVHTCGGDVGLRATLHSNSEFWCGVSEVRGIGQEVQPQILRLTTPKLKDVWGPVRSG